MWEFSQSGRRKKHSEHRRSRKSKRNFTDDLEDQNRLEKM